MNESTLDPRTFGRRRLLNAAEAADYVSTTERHVRRLANERRIPRTKIGGKLRFSPDALDAWITENTDAPAGT